jgi:hypothetical protein
MTLEQQVASLVTATTDLTTTVNAELNKVREENTAFKQTVVTKSGNSVIEGSLSVSSLVIASGAEQIIAGKGKLSLPRNTVFGVAANNKISDLSNGCTAIGYASLLNNLSGRNCTAVGDSSLFSVIDYNNCSALGAAADATGENQVQLGNSSTTTYVYGTVQNRSDLRDKTDVRNTILGLDFIKSLRPVDYRWDMREDYKPVAPQDPGIEATEEQKASYQAQIKTWLEVCKLKNIVHNGTKKRNRFHHGLIAQEVKAVLTQKGIDFGGYQDHSISGGDDVLSLGYDQFIAPLIKAVQELSAQNEALIARISALESNLK